MADFNQFGSTQPPLTGEAQHCDQCEAMLADALDGTLPAKDQAAFDLHMASCSTCSAMLADARRGAGWLEMLKSPRPEPPADLLERILAQTCNAQTSNQPQLVTGKQKAAHTMWQPSTILGNPGAVSATGPRSAGTYASTNVLPFRNRIAAGFRLRSIGQTLLQPRLAMTAAMAFFSIALTMNITGVHIRDLRLSDLRPSSMERNISLANARVLRYYDSLKVVYELESRVRTLQRTADSDGSYNLPSNQSAPAAQPNQQPGAQQQPGNQQPPASKPDSRQSRPKPGPGSSRRETPHGNFQLADSAERPDSLPATQAFVVFTPSILKYLQEGELV